ncbi:unnamed protein product, partial [Urochloa humidicola]
HCGGGGSWDPRASSPDLSILVVLAGRGEAHLLGVAVVRSVRHRIRPPVREERRLPASDPGKQGSSWCLQDYPIFAKSSDKFIYAEASSTAAVVASSTTTPSVEKNMEHTDPPSTTKPSYHHADGTNDVKNVHELKKEKNMED